MGIRSKFYLGLVSKCVVWSYLIMQWFYVIYFLGANEEYMCFEEILLPAFPLRTPSAFQILESDCKINPALVEQLRSRFFECQNNNAEEYINENLNNMLTTYAASVFSWSGAQGNIPLVKFKSMNVLIGWWNFLQIKFLSFDDHCFYFLFNCTISVFFSSFFLQIVRDRCVVLQPRMQLQSFGIGSWMPSDKFDCTNF